jgi:uncharacterized repeat protein (TIGR02543 family)
MKAACLGTIFILVIGILIPSSISIVAAQEPAEEYFLYVNLVGSGSVTYNGTGVYDPGDVVEITATPAVGWEFTGWSGDLSGSDSPEYITMDSNKTVTATFTEIPPGVHDVAAVSQTVCCNEVMPGDLVDIDVTVTNNGDYTETFDLTCYFDGVEIGTVLVVDLAPGEIRTATFTWDTTGVPQMGYAITAWADSGEVITEVDETNNWCTMPLNIFVIPELPLGTILASLSMFIALIGYVGFKRYRTK